MPEQIQVIKMNGMIPSVPITTLAGIASLTDLLPEMPLPTPLPQTLSNKSLLFHPRVADEAQILLSIRDENLLPQLLMSLSQTNADHIELKEQYQQQIALDTQQQQSTPELLKAIMQINPNIFKEPQYNSPRNNWPQHQQHHLSNFSPSYSNSSSSRQTPHNSPAHINATGRTNLPGGIPHAQHPRMPIAPQNHTDSITTQNSPFTAPSPSSRASVITDHHQTRTTPQHIMEDANCMNNLAGHQQQFNMHSPAQMSSSSPASLISSLGSITPQHSIHMTPPTDHHQIHQMHHQQQQVHMNVHQHQQQMYDPSMMNQQMHQQHQVMDIDNQPFALIDPVTGLPELDLPLDNINANHDNMNVLQQQQQQDIYHQNMNVAQNINSNMMPIPESIPQISLPYNQQQQPQHHQQEEPQQQSNVNTIQQTSYSQIQEQVQPTHQQQNNQMFETKFPLKEPVVMLNRLNIDDALLLNKMKKNQTPEKTEKNRRTSSSTTRNTGEKSIIKSETEDESDDEYCPSTKDSKYFKSKTKDRPKDKSKQQRTPLTPKRRRLTSEDNEDKDEIMTPVKPKIRKFEMKLIPVLPKLSVEELMETNTYQKFNNLIETIFENTEEAALAEVEEDEDVPSELLIAEHQLHALCSEAAKLKSLAAMESVPSDRLVRLLNILEKNIRDGAKVSPLADPDDDVEQSRMWADIAMSRVQQAMDASLVCLNIMTSSNMPKTIYLEDVIDRIILFMKFQLQNTIYPSYDPVYRIDTKSKSDNYNAANRKKRGNVKEVREKNILLIYSKMHELVVLLSELLNIQILTDTSVLHASTLGVAPFFVENISDLQLSALKLVTVIFTKYEKHRRLLLDDILASIARLPSSKRSLRTYKLSTDDHIQMLTALVLQLIQCVVVLPDSAILNSKEIKEENGEDKKISSTKISSNVDVDVLILSKYEAATRLAANFLTVFLKKCSSKGDEVDYRPIFENFVQDLLATVNKPEWPAAELMLSLLGTLLVSHFSNKSSDMALRVVSIEYLGVVASKLRKDTVQSHCKLSTIDQIINDIKVERQRDSDYDQVKDKEIPGLNEEEERFVFLQKVLLDYLAVSGTKDSALNYARHFYLAQWYRDCALEKTRVGQSPQKTTPKKLQKKKNRKKGRNRISDDESEDEPDVEEITEDNNEDNEEKFAEVYQIIEEKKKLIISKIRPYSTGTKPDVLQTFIDYKSAELISQYLASKRPFSRSFDLFLQQILKVLTETSIAIRTKAMKCLTSIVEADPSVLARGDMQIGVRHSFLDQSTSVREAAVDLVGKFVLSRPELIEKYYDILLKRILDTGVSVRKRVIKILKDICVEYPDYPKVPEICVKMIRRVNDEEGIRKLVMEVFQNMWFTPVSERPTLDKKALLRKVMNITDVVAACKDIGLEWFEQLLVSLFKPREDKEDSTKMNVEPPKALLTACRQIVDCLIENVLTLEETNFNSNIDTEEKPRLGSSQRLCACLITLHLFAKIRPQLLVNHALTLQPYLSLKCQTKGEFQIIGSVAQTLELVVPLMEHPSETFLAQLEEDSVKLILQHDKSVVASCLSCLGSIVNNVTKNYKLIRDCFNKYYGYLINYKLHYEKNPNSDWCKKYIGFFKRALFTVGLLLRYFDFTDPQVTDGLPENIKDQVFDTLYYFVTTDNNDTKSFTLSAIGSVCIRHYEFMMLSHLKELYHHLLTSECVAAAMKIEVLGNIELYLLEEERRMIKQDQEWAKMSKQENLKEMGDISSGMASTVIQLYLKQILESFLHENLNVRLASLKVIQLILAQGLVHPVQIVPYLICMSTDSEKTISHSADKQLQDIEKKYPGFIHMKAQFGIRLSYRLQSILQNESLIKRGMRLREGEYPSALNGFLYTILRNTKQQRRAIVNSFLKQFEESSKTSLSQMLYLADNLAYFSYQVQDEPLFIIHHIDIIISMSGTNLVQSFREALLPKEGQEPQNVLPQYLENLTIQPDNQQNIQNQQQHLLLQEQQLNQQNFNPQMQQNQLAINDQQQQQYHLQDQILLGVPQVPIINELPAVSGPIMHAANATTSTKNEQQRTLEDEEDDEEDEESVLARLPEDTRKLREYIIASQGFLLLLNLRQHLKDLYGFSDAKISQYSPSEAAKVYEKAVNRKTNQHYKPKTILEKLKENVDEHIDKELNEEERRLLVKEYLDFKLLMLKFDPEDPEDEDDEDGKKNMTLRANTSGNNDSVNNESTSTTVKYQVQVQEQSNSDNPNQPPRVPKLTIHAHHHSDQKEHHHHRNKHKTSGQSKVEKPKKHKKKKRRRLSETSDSGDDYSDPDFMA